MSFSIVSFLLLPTVYYLAKMNNNCESTTFALIKPDAVHSAQQILNDIEHEGFKIQRKKTIKLTKSQARQFYKEHSERDFYNDLVEYITSGPVTALVLSRENAVSEWRNLLGPTDSIEARKSDPQSIRAKYGQNKQMNAAHGSDSEVSAEREIQFFFKEAEYNFITDNIEVTRFLEKNVYPVLTEGLDQLIKTNPKDPISYLGKFLMEHPQAQ